MAGFRNIKLTSEGKGIINKLLQGETKINFSKVEIGDGENNVAIEDKKELSHKILECQIRDIKEYDTDKVKISFYFNNQDLKESFYFKELGIYVVDTNTNKEVLFCYGNSKEAEYISIDEKEIIERYINVIVFCGNAENVEIALNKEDVFVSEQMLEEVLKRRVYHFENVQSMKKCLTLLPRRCLPNFGLL